MEYCFAGPFATKEEAFQSCPGTKEFSFAYLNEDGNGDGEQGYVCYRVKSDSTDDCSIDFGSGYQTHTSTCGEEFSESEDPCHQNTYVNGKIDQCCGGGSTMCTGNDKPEYSSSSSPICTIPNSFQAKEITGRMCEFGPRATKFTAEECPYHQKEGDDGYYCSHQLTSKQEAIECLEQAELVGFKGNTRSTYCSSSSFEYSSYYHDADDNYNFCRSHENLDLGVCCNDQSDENNICHDFYNSHAPFHAENKCCAEQVWSWSAGEGLVSSAHLGCYIQAQAPFQCPSSSGWIYQDVGSHFQCVKDFEHVNSFPQCSETPIGDLTNVQSLCQIGENDVPHGGSAMINCIVELMPTQPSFALCPEGEGWRYQSSAEHGHQCIKQRLVESYQPDSHCLDGMFEDNQERCSPCFPGTVPSDDRKSCKPCQAGTYSPGFLDDCILCDAGFFSLAGATRCTMCYVGSYSNPGSSKCEPCPEGLTSTPGASACKQCPV